MENTFWPIQVIFHYFENNQHWVRWEGMYPYDKYNDRETLLTTIVDWEGPEFLSKCYEIIVDWPPDRPEPEWYKESRVLYTHDCKCGYH